MKIKNISLSWNLFSKYYFLFLLLQCTFYNYSFGQAVAISGINTDTPDGFALVALVDIAEGSNIFFTDVSYNPSNNTFLELDINGNPSTANGAFLLSWTGTWTKGSVIRAVETGQTTFTLTSSPGGPSGLSLTNIYSGDNFSLSGSDGMSIYTSLSTTDPENNIGEIYGYVSFSPTTLDPNPNDDPDCPCSPDFVGLEFNNSSIDAFNFNPAIRGNELGLSDFTNLSNYVTSGSNITLDLTEFDNITFGSGESLPVELVMFSAQKIDDKKVQIIWETASETNNDYFEIEHSLNGKDFRSLGNQKGAGTTNQTSYYSFLHNVPIKGLNYYRLKQVDLDGTVSFSEVEVVRFETNVSRNIDMTFFPNPTKGLLQISLEGKSIESFKNLTYFIYDQMGQIVLKNYIETESMDFTLNIENLVSGVYFLMINNNETIYSAMFMKE